MSELFILVGPSGVGKTTLATRLMLADPNIHTVPSFTTRYRREGEVDGVDYVFITGNQFDCMETRGDFLAFSTVYGNKYGTTKQGVYAKLHKGHDVLLVLDYKGLQDALEVFPNAVSVFIAPPSTETLEKRLKARGKDPLETIKHRLRIAENELRNARELDHLIVNECVDCASEQLKHIVRATRRECSVA